MRYLKDLTFSFVAVSSKGSLNDEPIQSPSLVGEAALRQSVTCIKLNMLTLTKGAASM